MPAKKSHHSKPKVRVIRRASPPTPKTQREIALDFASAVHKKFDAMVKATILFGSQAKNTAKPTSDIDIIIIIDDASIQWDLELIAWYREELGKVIASNPHGVELHVNTVKLTTWWQDLLYGDPVVINVLRYGEVLIDIGGFFNPLKALLLQGRIKSTPEAIYSALQRVPSHLSRSQGAEMGSIEGVYWAMVDSSQAALMALGKLPPSPEHIPNMLQESFVNNRLLSPEYVKWYKEIFSLHKGILHGEVRDVKGVEVDMWQDRANQFVRTMTKLVDEIIESRK